MRSMSYVYIVFSSYAYSYILDIHSVKSKAPHIYYFRDVFHMRFSSDEQSISNILLLKSLVDLLSPSECHFTHLL